MTREVVEEEVVEEHEEEEEDKEDFKKVVDVDWIESWSKHGLSNLGSQSASGTYQVTWRGGAPRTGRW